MSHVLSLPYGELSAFQWQTLQTRRHRGQVSDTGTVTLDPSAGKLPVLRFANGDDGLPAGTEVLVSWRGGGLVCDALATLQAAQDRLSDVQRQIEMTRRRLEQARQARLERTTTISGELYDESLPRSAPAPLA